MDIPVRVFDILGRIDYNDSLVGKRLVHGRLGHEADISKHRAVPTGGMGRYSFYTSFLSATTDTDHHNRAALLVGRRFASP